MAIQDRNMDWLEAIEYIPAQSFQTYITGAGVAAGDPVLQEIGTSGIVGIQINQASDAIATLWHMGNRVDITKQIRFRVLLAINSTDADAETYTVTYTPIIAGTTVLVAPVTALSTAIPALTYGAVAAVPTFTDFGILNRSTLTNTTSAMALNVAATMTNASANEISILGLEIRYSPRLTNTGERKGFGAWRTLTTRPLGTQLASPGRERA